MSREHQRAIKSIAKQYLIEGYCVGIDYDLPAVWVVNENENYVYNEQGYEALAVLSETDSAVELFDVQDKEWILYRLHIAGAL